MGHIGANTAAKGWGKNLNHVYTHFSSLQQGLKFYIGNTSESV